MNAFGSGKYRDGGGGPQSGMVLVIVLVMISVIIAVTVELVRSSRSEYYEAANMRDHFRTIYLAKSGFYRAQSFLAQDVNNYDALFEKWAKSDVISAQSSALFDDGYFKASIEDESGKIPVNRLVSGNDYNLSVRDALIRLLSQPDFNLQAQQVADIIIAIKDFMDPDMEASGVEKGTPESAGCKNGPLDSIEELLQVKGITEELFYGTEKKPGIVPFLTVYGEGKININTAPRIVLKSLAAEITDDAAARMEEYRKSEGNKLSDLSWYRNLPGLSGVNLDQNLVEVRSRIFRITSTGHYGKMTQTVTGVVDRGEAAKGMKILLWKVN